MFHNDREKIQADWQEEMYPKSDSIMIKNGFYCLFESPGREKKIKNKTWIPALDFGSTTSITCEGLATISTTEDSEGNVIHCGECLASGEDGFVAMTNKNTDELIWLIVLSNTNPFQKIEFSQDCILATSSNGTTLTIPQDRPDNLFIDWS
ncbi:hypothetical protein ACOI9X_13055 [Pseudomonas sp. P2757]|uniref:hypothetical protein n=1 Tax=unclassified Pseudomonas TaxID=196821 RepID=UPI003B5A40BE